MLGAATAMNLGRLLTQTARRLPDRTALVWGGRRWTWAELDARVDRLAGALRARGVGGGDRVLVHSRSSNAMFESQWACFKLGAVWVPTNSRLTPPGGRPPRRHLPRPRHAARPGLRRPRRRGARGRAVVR